MSEWLDSPDGEGWFWLTHIVRDVPPVVVRVMKLDGQLKACDTQRCQILVDDQYGRHWKRIEQQVDWPRDDT